jgi:alpha-L-fucosidase
MKINKIFLFAVFIFVLPQLYAQSDKNEALKRFKDAKLGIFIHWGLYSQIGYTEWCQNNFEIQAENYKQLAETFNPKNFNSDEWAKLIKSSGAKYCVFTAKHHEGFSMYNTSFSDYSINNTPYKKDILGMLAKSLKNNNIELGIYYSVMDWYHPDYLPRRYFDKRDITNANTGRYKLFFRNQVMELIEKYNPSILWFDGEWENTHDSTETVDILNSIYSKKSNILINNRLSRYYKGDFQTPENVIPATGIKDDRGEPLIWEVCHTINDSWGYNPYSKEFLSERDIIRTLIDVVSKGGNLLLNIGPAPDGKIQTEFVERLNALGKWLSVNGESIYETDASVFPFLPFYGRSTTKGDKIYIHVFMKPKSGKLNIPLLNNKILEVYTLNDKRKLNYKIANQQIEIELPEKLYDNNASVIVVKLDSKPQPADVLPVFEVDNNIELSPENGLMPLDTKGLKAEQYYDKLRIRKWTAKQNDITIEWNFETKTEKFFNMKLFAANAFEKGGDCKIQIAIDNQNYTNVLPQREPWSYANKYIYDGVDFGKILLKEGKHKIIFKTSLIEDQQIIFEKILLTPEIK